MFCNFFFENRVLYEIMWKNIVDPGEPKATNILSEYVILITFPTQQ